MANIKGEIESRWPLEKTAKAAGPHLYYRAHHQPCILFTRSIFVALSCNLTPYLT